MIKNFSRFLKDESGATAIEYGLIAALITVVIVGTLGFVGTELDTTFDTIKEALEGANEGGGGE